MSTRQRLVEPLPYALGGTGIVVLQATRQILQEAAGLGDVGTAVGPRQDRLGRGALMVGQMIEHIAGLVHLAALDQGGLAKHLAHRFVQRLRAVEQH